MDNFFNIMRKTLYLVCLIAFLTGCGKETEPPPKPKVVTKKIVMVKKAVSSSTKSGKTVVKTPANKKVLPKPVPLKAAKKIGKPVPAIKTKAIVKSQPTDKKSGITAVSKVSKKKLVAMASTATTKIEIPETTGFYSPEGKLDPFEPLFKEKPAAVFPAKKKKLIRRTPLTPLEKVDLSQLKLVGIIRTKSGGMAMVEEASGKGYIVHKGTFIGIHSGKIVQILRDRIIVEEKSEDIYGKVSITKKPLQLQKPVGE